MWISFEKIGFIYDHLPLSHMAFNVEDKKIETINMLIYLSNVERGSVGSAAVSQLQGP